MTPIVVFDQVDKRYRLRQDRPHSLRELFVRRASLAGRGTRPGDEFFQKDRLSKIGHPPAHAGLLHRQLVVLQVTLHAVTRKRSRGALLAANFGDVRLT